MPVDGLTAFCGFNCAECPAYKATHGNDAKEQQRVADKWTKAVGKKVTPAETLCDGCHVSGGRLAAYCAECAIRGCAIAKAYPTCAHCPEMPTCGKITTRKTREMLEKLKKELGI
jgi:hypothetical protein